jgi:hypothetical protein
MRRNPLSLAAHRYVRAVLAAALLSSIPACNTSSSMPPDPFPHSPSMPSSGLPAKVGVVEPLAAEQVFNTQKHPDSPNPANDIWRGVLIKAPSLARLEPRRPAVIVRGVYALSGLQMPAKAALKIIAIDAQTKHRYEAPMGQPEPSPEEPPPERPPLDPKLRERLTFNGHFNVELFATLGLPLVAATYVVWAEVGPNRSNEISVKLQLP